MAHGGVLSMRYFPRIRGDGPEVEREGGVVSEFSPYSRGWSPGQ